VMGDRLCLRIPKHPDGWGERGGGNVLEVDQKRATSDRLGDRSRSPERLEVVIARRTP
jgi:hypothetical protein